MMHLKMINALIILIAGISLLMMALPRLRGSINQIPVDNFFVSINDRKIPEIAIIPKYIEISKTSIALHETPGYWQDQASLWFHQAQLQGGISGQSKASLTQAENAARRSLFLSPANSFLSYQLGVISAIEKKPSSEIIRLLLMSIMTSPYEPGFMLHRLDFCLMYFASLNSEDYPYIVDQILLIWEYSQKEFLALLQYRNDYPDLIKILLLEKHSMELNEMLTALKDA